MAKRSPVVATRTTTTSIANTETQVLGLTLPVNTVRVGSRFRVSAHGLQTNTTGASTSIHRFRIGTSSLGGAIPASWSGAMGTTARTNVPFNIDGSITILTLGASGTAIGQFVVILNSATALNINPTVVTGAVTINTTTATLFELTTISGASTTTWNYHSAFIRIDGA